MYIIVIIMDPNTTVAMTMEASLGSMNAFDPDMDDWSAYVERLELFFTVNEIKDKKKVSVLVTFLGVKFCKIISPRINQQVRDTMTW